MYIIIVHNNYINLLSEVLYCHVIHNVMLTSYIEMLITAAVNFTVYQLPLGEYGYIWII